LGEYTFLPFLAGTVSVTGLALCCALPLSLGVAVYLTEYARSRFKALMKPVIDVLAGLPSVIFGLWGTILIVPFVREVVAPLFGVVSRGYTLLSAALVLAVMIAPVMIQIMIEVLQAVPNALREAVFALGATPWEAVIKVVIPKALPGIIAAVVLSLARAFGETLAVMMVIGNGQSAPDHPLLPASTFPTFIANRYGEMSSDPITHAALMGAAFILFMVVVGFTIISRLVLARVKRRMR
jgi:phosphate transport system permease protein